MKIIKKVVATVLCTAIVVSGCLNANAVFAAASRTESVTAKQTSGKKVVKLSWKRTGNVKKYVVSRSVKKAGKYTRLKTVTGTKKKLTFKDKTVKYGRTYYYKVKGKGLKASKAVKVMVKAKGGTVNNEAQNILHTTAPELIPNVPASVAPASSVPANRPGDNQSSDNKEDEGRNPTDKVSPAPDVDLSGPTPTPLVTPDVTGPATPVPTVNPNNKIDVSGIGNEGEDYYVINGGDVTGGFDKVADVSDNVITVKSNTTILFSGNVSDKEIICGADNLSIDIALNAADISNTTVPFIYNEYAGSRINIYCVGTTESAITAVSGYSAAKPVICSEGDIEFKGAGTININSQAADVNAVKSENNVNILDGRVNISSKGKGISGKPVNVSGGVVVIEATDDGIRAKGSKGAVISGGILGIKSGKDGINSNKAVTMTGGSVTINSTDDGIQCGNGEYNTQTSEFDINEGAVNIGAGTMNIKSQGAGIKGNVLVSVTGGDIYIESEGKGIKAGTTYQYPEETETPSYTKKQSGYVNVTGGTIVINSTDHGISANGNLVSASQDDNDCAVTVAGGYVTVNAKATLTTASGNNNNNWGGMFGSSKTSYEASGGDGINSNSGVAISGGYIIVGSGNDAIQAEKDITIKGSVIDAHVYGKGLKAGYTITDTEESYYGELSIKTSKINIVSFDDAVHCNNNVSILSGELTLSSADDGIHADNDLNIGSEEENDAGPVIKVTESEYDNKSITPYEGLEAAYIYIYSGDIDLWASDDGINAAGGKDSSGTNGTTNNNDNFGPGGNTRPGGGGWMPGRPGGMESSSYGEVHISGGDIYIDADGDSVDSNGTITMTGGNILIDGSANGSDDVIDCDSGFYVNGGTLAAVGCKGVSTKCGSTGSSQYNVLFTSSSKASAGTAYEVKDEEGNVIISGETKKQTNVYLFTSERFSDGKYTIYLNGTAKGSVTFSSQSNNYSVSI